jgi:hypothetical protein
LTPAPKARYSLSWANWVVSELREKYARALTSVEELLAIDDRIVAKYLALGDPVYPNIRHAVHIVDAWQKSPNWAGWTRVNKRMFTLQMRKMGYVRIADRLDNEKIDDRIEEQGSREGGGVSEASEPAFLWSSKEETPDGIQFLLFPEPLETENGRAEGK